MKKLYVSQSELPKYREVNKPAYCPILGHANFIPVVDHDHKSGCIRGVVSSEGNALLGKIENFFNTRCVNGRWNLPQVLRQLAYYLEAEQGPLHPVGIRQVTKRFGRMKVQDQMTLLLEAGATQESIDACKNTKQRTKLYRKTLVSEGAGHIL